MLNQILDHINNYFIKDVYRGEFTIEDSQIFNTLPLHDGQYFRICGSIFNDGVYQYPAYGLVDEVFEGEIWALAIPPAIISLAHEIGDWQAKYGESVVSPFQSESFGGYSYSKGSVSNGNGGSASIDWKSAFGSQLNRWRKFKTGVDPARKVELSSVNGRCNHHESLD